MEDSEVVFIPKEEFLTLLYHNHDISNRLIRMLANRISEKEKMLPKSAYDYQLFLHAKYQTAAEQYPSIQMSRHDMTSIVGSSPAAVTSTLSDSKNKGLIDDMDGKIFIVDEQGLQYIRN